MAISDKIYSPIGEETPINLLHDELSPYFELEVSGTNEAGENFVTTVDIAEPIGWDSIKLTLNRSTDYFGFTTEYLSGDVALSFDCEAGYSFILGQYEKFGTDAEIVFRSGVIFNGIKYPEFDSRLDLNTYAHVPGQISCTIIRNSLNDVIGTRGDTQLNFLEEKDVDGNGMNTPPLVGTLLHSQGLAESFIAEIKEPVETQFAKPGTGALWLQFPTDNPSSNQVKDSFPTPFGISELEPIENKKYLVKFLAEGPVQLDLHFAFNWTFKMTTTWANDISPGRTYIVWWRMQGFIAIKRTSGDVIKYPLTPMKEENPRTKSFSTSYAVPSFSSTLDIKQGDELYLYVWFDWDNTKEAKGLEAFAKVTDFGLKIAAQTIYSDSISQGFFIGDVLKTAVHKMCGLPNKFWSRYYSFAGDDQPTDGCGASRIITSGALIRQTPLDKATVTVSWKELLDSLKAIDGIGLGWELQHPRGDVLRCEHKSYFFQNVETLAVSGVGELKIEAAKDLLPNRLTIGYEKYQDEAETQLDEVHGQHEYATPIRTNRLDLNLLSKLIASGILIERTRRAVYKEGSTDSSTFDDAPFIMDVTVASVYSAYVKVVNDKIQIRSTDLYFAKGQKVIITTSSIFSKTYNITKVEPWNESPAGQVGWILTTDDTLNLLPFEGTAQYSIDGVTQQSLSSEPFSVVTGIQSPDRSYNLLMTPKRMMLANAEWLAGIGARKQIDRLFRSSRVRFNGGMVTQMADSWTCQRGDRLKMPIREGEDMTVSRLGEPLFIPEWITFKTKLTFQQVRSLFNSYRGLDASKGYGYIRVNDDDGYSITGWLYECEFTPVTGETTFKLLRRYARPTPEEGQECSQFADFTFEDWQATYPGDWIEWCVFNSFD